MMLSLPDGQDGTRPLSTKYVQLLIESAGKELVSVIQGVFVLRAARHCTM